MMPISPALTRVRRFQQAYSWVARDHLLANKAKLAGIITLNAIGAVAQGGMIVFIAFVIDQLQTDAKLGFAPLDRLLSHPLAKLSVLGLCLLLMVILGACATYAATVRTRALGRSFHERCMTRSVRMLEEGTSLSHPGMPPTRSDLKRSIVRDSNHLGKSLETLVRMCDPIFRLIVLIVLLVSTSWSLSLIILPLFIILVPVIYKTNSSVQRISRRYYEKSVVDRNLRLASIVSRINAQNLHVAEEESFDPSRDETILAYFDEFDRLNLSKERVQFIMILSSSILPVLALLIGGYLATTEALSWGDVMAYLIALLLLVTAVRAIQGQLTAMSLFYPAINRYLASQKAMPDDAEEEEPSEANTLLIKSCRDIPGGDTTLVLEPGRPVYYVTDCPLNRVNLANVVAPLMHSKSPPKSFWRSEISFIDAQASMVESSLGGVLGNDPTGSRREHALEWLESLGARGGFEELVGGLTTPITTEQWSRMDDSLKLALLTAPLTSDNRRLVLLEIRLLSRAERATSLKLLANLHDRLVLLVSGGMSLVPAFADRAVVARNGRVVGVGDLAWFEERVKPELASGVSPAMEDEVLDDDE